LTHIDIRKLKKGDEILLETEEFVYLIKMISPSIKSVQIEGGRLFKRKQRAKIHGSYTQEGEAQMMSGCIMFGEKLELSYKKGNIHNTVCLAPIVSGKIIGINNEGDSWYYEVWG